MASSPDAAPAYAELHCLSNFSFLRGASHPEELVRRAADLGYHALAITDECSLAGVVRAHVAARERGLQLIIGSEFRLTEGPRLVLLATDRNGYGRLSQLISRARRAAEKGSYRLECADLSAGIEGCLALLLPRKGDDRQRLGRLARRFASRCWIAVERLHGPHDHGHAQYCRTLAAELSVPLVATGDVHMHARGRRALHDTLTAIRLGCTVAEAGLALQANGERHLRPRERLARLYPSAWLEQTLRIAERCRFSLEELRYQYPQELVPDGMTTATHLRMLVEAGMRSRWPAGAPARVQGLVEHELALIAELRYESYFLTVHDIVRFAREHGILCQGRGSAANSAVCYCLGITEVDPSRMSLLFERFISRERGEPPDIDVDFEHERREEVIQYIYAKYGRERAALAATVISYRPKSAIRDVGKALGMAPAHIEAVTRSLVWGGSEPIPPQRLRELGLDPEGPMVRRWLVLATTLIGFPRHLSQHVGGFVISHEPLSRLVPVENAAMPERTVIQWDKDDLDAMGLLKVDVLALGMLSAIRRALELVNRHRGTDLCLAGIPPEDPAVYRMLQRADTIGVFQIESRAQMSMLPRLKPRNFYDLVIEIALVRPGPIQGEMVHPYLRRRQGLEPVVYPSKAVRGVLERTLGVPIFQEQVMHLAMAAAGFTAGEADQLRRAMAAWRRKGNLAVFQQRLRDGMYERGYDAVFAGQICRQIEGFAEYGFPESHSASFALLAYASAWLKRHEPAAFTTALLNSQPMGFYAPSQLLQDARRHGVEIRKVDVQTSAWDCTLEPTDARQPALRLGLRLVKGLSSDGVQGLIEARAQAPFADMDELSRRGGLSRRDLKCLAAAGALESLAGHRHLARWQALGLQRQGDLLRDVPIADDTPPLAPPGEGEDLVADYGHLGFTLGRHPLALLRGRFPRRRFCSSAELRRIPHDHAARTAGLVTGRQRPGTATGVVFLTLEDEFGSINVVVWRELAERCRALVLHGRLIGVSGVVERSDGVHHLIARQLEDYDSQLGRLSTKSRDFH
ncbi:MAG: error-prone DNA polymerase [Acidihalobacter sp.]|uniref:error-prone DNA polymerase n=1 Tax=Acidihalobacter sp. TaxID=1872108 RepID=UPI00307DFD56